MSSACLMPVYERLPVHFVRGEGSCLWDDQGNQYLESLAGVAVTNLGHSHPEITAAISAQAATLMHSSNLYGVTWQETLAATLCSLTGMEKAFFCNSGAEANETAIKLARLHARQRRITAPQIVVMDGAFHGRTLATLTASGNPAAQQGFEPLVPGFLRLPLNDRTALNALDGNPQICAVLLETVQGEGGVRLADSHYLQALARLCRANNWLLMIDEVQTGMGRTGRHFGYQHADIQPDVITLAKGLGNGLPIGACLARGAAANLFAPGQHGSTFGGNPLACRVGHTVISIMQRDRLAERAAELGRQLLEGLTQALAGHPQVAAIRGRGLMVGIELKEAIPDLTRRALLEERLLINVTRQKVIRLLPALTISPEEISILIAALSRLLHSNQQLRSA